MAMIRLVTRVFEGSLFTFAQFDTPITWDESVTAAGAIDRSNGNGHLATLTTQEQANFAGSVAASMPGMFVGNSGPWIGLSREDGLAFEWVTGEAVSFTNWAPGEPNNFETPERWVQLWMGSGLWNDNDQTFPREEMFGFVGEEIAATPNRISGTAGNDDIELGDGNDRAKGAGGDDIVDGGEGHDRVGGGKGNDHLSGALGRDIVEGGKGNDTINLGSGIGHFVFGRGDGSDLVEDFDVTRDKLSLSRDLWGPDLTTTQIVDRFAQQTDSGVSFVFATGSFELSGASLTGLADAIEII